MTGQGSKYFEALRHGKGVAININKNYRTACGYAVRGLEKFTPKIKDQFIQMIKGQVNRLGTWTNEVWFLDGRNMNAMLNLVEYVEKTHPQPELF